MVIYTEKSTFQNAKLTPSRSISSVMKMKLRMALFISLFKMKTASTAPLTHIFQHKPVPVLVLKVVNVNIQEPNFMIIQYAHVDAKKRCAHGECSTIMKPVNVNV